MTVEKIEDSNQPKTETAKTTARTTKRTARSTKAKPKEEVVALSVAEETKPAVQLIEHTGLLPGDRPIEAGHLDIVSTYTSVGGQRPVVSSGMEVVGTLTISGSRPISSSGLEVSEVYAVMGNRPVASNEIDDPATLMGYLD